MQNQQATGVDTKAMVPILTAGFFVLIQLFLPWFSIPQLKYAKLPVQYRIWEFPQMLKNLQNGTGVEHGIQMSPFLPEQMENLHLIGEILKGSAVLLIVLLVLSGITAYREKIKRIGYIRSVFFMATVQALGICGTVSYINYLINQQMGRENNFLTLTIRSKMQFTAYPCAQCFLGIFMILAGKRLLNTKKEENSTLYRTNQKKEDKKIGKRTKVSMLLILFAIPLIVFFGIVFLNDRNETFIALCMIGLAMIPFGMVFEDRKPQAREILLIAVMSAIAVTARVAFFMIPQFKPSAAIIIITAAGLGAEAGFLTGAVTGFVSNFFFGQGPWTPWQMFAFGIIGFLAGLIFRKKRGKWKRYRFWLCVYGGLAVLIIYGALLDTGSVFMGTSGFQKEIFLASYISGFPFNLVHAFCTVIFLFLLSEPFLKKLDRIKKKYGILEP